ncbi:MAG: GNAT family N-acetyltransferase [Planctomycetota bacterium]
MSHEQLIIRRATQTDTNAILARWAEFQAFHARLDPAYATASGARAKFASHLRQLMRSRKSRVFVAVTGGGRVIGFLTVSEAMKPPVLSHRRHGFLMSMGVAARCRRHGVGRALVRAAENWFRERRLPEMELMVATANRAACGFWGALGFRTYMHRMRRRIRQR